MAKVFFITGTTTGFGKEMVAAALAGGNKVVATSRNSSKLSFEGGNDDNLLTVDLDVTKKDQIDAAFDAAIKKFGRIDVLTNNAGFGLSGPFETLTEEQARYQFEINYWGALATTRKAIDLFRSQSPPGGLIQQITSIGAQRGVPLFSAYCGTKWALEAATESIRGEMKPEWGIKFTCIEPGGFRTEWTGGNMVFGENQDIQKKYYDHLDPKKMMGERHGTQAGDPKKGGQAFYDLAMKDDPPFRLVLGSDAHAAITQKIKTYDEEIKKWEKTSLSTDVDGYKPPK